MGGTTIIVITARAKTTHLSQQIFFKKNRLPKNLIKKLARFMFFEDYAHD
jgi:hypothetical protein